MKAFMLIITVVALLDALFTIYMVNTLCPEEQLALNIFFGIITAFIIWILAFQVQEMKSKA
jgi:hydrogenase-4 membrane subunit HyfE